MTLPRRHRAATSCVDTAATKAMAVCGDENSFNGNQVNIDFPVQQANATGGCSVLPISPDLPKWHRDRFQLSAA